MSPNSSAAKAPTFWRSACGALSRADPVMAAIIAQHRGSFLVSRGDVFTTLARAIVGQQISVKAAAAVWARFLNVVHPLSPGRLASLTTADLDGCGLSARKREYLLGLGNYFAQQPSLESSLHDMTDEAVIAALTELRGVGRWTAEMVLIFALLRPNVLPLADLGLMKAIALHYRNGRDISPRQAERIAAVWAPWRSVATWYLWRSLDP
ncbi:MAG: DNA-3-methyladenine glycosylase 2 family protein, partial [Betaproteobacteria bacterium]|nr:DNA-3-methyladenine glycosylase 2 family protein [Betaproteobacteria bacterium]